MRAHPFVPFVIFLLAFSSSAQGSFTSSISEDGFSFSIEYSEKFKKFEVEKDELYYFTSNKELTMEDIDEGKFGDGFMILYLEGGENVELIFDEMIEEATIDGDVEIESDQKARTINGQRVLSVNMKIRSEDIPLENMLMSATGFGENVVFIMFVSEGDGLNLEDMFDEVWESWHLLESE